MATKKPPAAEPATSPLVASIDPRQLALSLPGDGVKTDDIRGDGTDPAPPFDVPAGASPLVASIDPAQLAVSAPGDGTDTADPRDGADQPSAIPPWGPADVSNVVDPSDPMTLTGHDAQPGEAAKKK